MTNYSDSANIPFKLTTSQNHNKEPTKQPDDDKLGGIDTTPRQFQINLDDVVVIEYLIAQSFSETLYDLLLAIDFPKELIDQLFETYKIRERHIINEMLKSLKFDYFKLSEYMCKNFDEGYGFLNKKLSSVIDFNEDCVDIKFKLLVLHAVSMIKRQDDKEKTMEFITENLVPLTENNANKNYKDSVDNLVLLMLQTRDKTEIIDHEDVSYDDLFDDADDGDYQHNFETPLYRISLMNKLNYLILDLQYSQICQFQDKNDLPRFIKKHATNRPVLNSTTRVDYVQNLKNGTVLSDKQYHFPLDSNDREAKIDTNGLLDDSATLNSTPLTFTSNTWNYEEDAFSYERQKLMDSGSHKPRELLYSQDNPLFDSYKPRISELFTVERWQSKMLDKFNIEI